MKNIKFAPLLFIAFLIGGALPTLGGKVPAGSSSHGYRLVPFHLLDHRLEFVPYKNAQRERTLLGMFRSAGCAGQNLTTELVSKNRPPQVLCRLQGQTNSLIIVGGHLDHVRRGSGIVDDWSGASMLPSLYQALRSQPCRHTFLFIGFTEEERGRVGSRYFVTHLTPTRLRRVRAMVNLECLGMYPPEVWEDHANPVLLRNLSATARYLGTYVPGADCDRIGYDDAMSFRRFHVPTITIHSITQPTVRVLHTRRDNLSAIHLSYYNQAYWIVAAYLATLDAQLPVTPRQP